MLSATPKTVMVTALKTGNRETHRDPEVARPTRWRAYRNAKPTAVRVMARPTLNATTSSMPYAVLFNAIAASSRTRADGQGTKPPETPRANKLFHVTLSPLAPGGRCECRGPPP